MARPVAWATILGVPIGIAAVVLAFLALQGDNGSRPGGASASAAALPKLRLVDLIVHNDWNDTEPSLDLMVRNAGTGSAAVSRALIEIRRVEPLPLCFTQGDLPSSERYGAELPVDANPGTVIEAPLHQQIAPGGVDRFQIGLSAVGGEPGEEPGVHIFEVSVALQHDGSSQPLEMGSALASLPSPPSAVVYYLAAGELAEVSNAYNIPDPRTGWAEVMPCWQANGRTLADLSKSAATRSGDLEEALSRAVEPSYTEG